jgi:hypothetical protein
MAAQGLAQLSHSQPLGAVMTAWTNEHATSHTLTDTAGPRWATVTALPVEDARVTDIEKVRMDRLTAAKQRRAAARTRDLTALLRDRPDLAGVHAPADFAVEAVRWCV